MAAPSGHQRYHQRQQLQRQQLRYKRSRSGSSTSAAAAGAGCGSSQSRQVVASAEGMHAAAASKSTSWRTPATSRYVLPAFSLLIINKPAMCVFRWCSSASLHDTAAAARWGTMVAALQVLPSYTYLPLLINCWHRGIQYDRPRRESTALRYCPATSGASSPYYLYLYPSSLPATGCCCYCCCCCCCCVLC